MGRYDSDITARFDGQFAETSAEREDRWAAKRRLSDAKLIAELRAENERLKQTITWLTDPGPVVHPWDAVGTRNQPPPPRPDDDSRAIPS